MQSLAKAIATQMSQLPVNLKSSPEKEHNGFQPEDVTKEKLQMNLKKR